MSLKMLYMISLSYPLQEATAGATTVDQPSVVLMTCQTKPTVADGAFDDDVFIYPSPAYCGIIRDDGLKVDETIRDDGFKLDAAC